MQDSHFPISDERALKVYEQVFGESGRDERAASIVNDLRQVAYANTVEDAERVIAWWDCWAPQGPHRFRATVRRLRTLLRPKRPTMPRISALLRRRGMDELTVVVMAKRAIAQRRPLSDVLGILRQDADKIRVHCPSLYEMINH